MTEFKLQLNAGAHICDIDSILQLNLTLPPYQRPYKWSVKSVFDLLEDIDGAIKDEECFKGEFKYRIGTIILNAEVKDNETVYNVVDGQQRLLSLVLIKIYLEGENFKCSLRDCGYDSTETQKNLHDNYRCVCDWFLKKTIEYKGKFKKAFKDVLEAVVIVVDKIAEAFQLFDSQNTRGKELDPHDLLKAYHLREMREYPYEMQRAVTRWEAVQKDAIKDLFSLYLFPALNWTRREKAVDFTDRQIDAYKGVRENSAYTYAKRASQSKPYFQINHPFIAGNDFFAMVEHYLQLLQDIRSEIATNVDFDKLHELISTQGKNSTGFKYASNLFYCALLCYYDKFHNFDFQAVLRLFTWAFMLRVDMKNLGYDSINKYAIGEVNDTKYTNTVAMFSVIAKARMHTEISNIQIKILKGKGVVAAENGNWEPLYERLKQLNDLGGTEI